MKHLMMSVVLSMTALSMQAQSGSPAMAMNHKETRKEHHEQRITLKALKGQTVSDWSVQQFANDFGDIPDVTWTRDLYFDKATFTNAKGKEMSAFYDDQGQLVGTASPAKFSDLPLAGRKEIMKHYTGYEDAPVVFFDDNEDNETDMILYGEQFEDADNYFIEVKDKKNRPVVLKVNPDGNVAFFADVNH